MSKIELGSRLFETSYLEGEFRLRSGKISSGYFDKYQFESDPNLLREIVKHLASVLPPETEILAGLEMGGIPISTALSLHTGLPQILVRKKAKEYGTEKLAEGVGFRGKNLVIVEDVITTGGQVVISANELRRRGAFVNFAVCVIERDVQGGLNLQQNGIELRALFTTTELKGLRKD